MAERLISNVGGNYLELSQSGFAAVHVKGGKIENIDIIELEVP